MMRLTKLCLAVTVIALPLLGLTPPPKERIDFSRDGHGITVLALAALHGFAPARSRELAFVTELPDLCRQYSATEVAIKKVFSWSWRQSIIKSVHSLHGGDAAAVAERRAALALHLRGLLGDPSDALETGLALHAFGDAYAHVKPDGSAFNSIFGHLLSGKEPDHISSNFEAYVSYLRALDELLRPHSTTAPAVASARLDSVVLELGKWRLRPQRTVPIVALAGDLLADPLLFDQGRCEEYQRDRVEPVVERFHRHLQGE